MTDQLTQLIAALADRSSIERRPVKMWIGALVMLVATVPATVGAQGPRPHDA